MKTTLFFRNNYYPSNIVTLINKSIHLTNNRLNSTVSNNKLNSFILDGINIPKLNINRNQKRLTNTVRAIVAFLETQTQFPDVIRVELATLLQRLEIMYFRNPQFFVSTCKVFSNWFKANISLIDRKQDMVVHTDWSVREKCPTLLVPILNMVNLLETERERVLLFRMILSILDIYRVVVVPNPPKLSTITDPYKGGEKAWTRIDVLRAAENLGIDLDNFRTLLKIGATDRILHSSAAAGPNGQAVWMAHIDAKAIMNDNILFNHLDDFAKLIGAREVMFLLTSCLRLPQFFAIKESLPQHSKLHFIWEKGDKVRTIAIVDYFTQELLTPLHNAIASTIEKIEMDGTFDQDKIANKVKAFTANSTMDLFSLDLSAATDRLPIMLQIEVLDKLTGIEGFGELWAKVLTDRDYTMPNGQTQRYAVGQPMGAKSSFPMLALTHHLIVQEAAHNVGISNFKDYVILGDDVMIAHELVAGQYLNLMEDLGLEISGHKSIVNLLSKRRFTMAEICRRLYSAGYEMTPLPVNLLANVIENQDMLYQLQDEMTKKGLILIPSNWSAFVACIVSNQEAFDRIALYNGLPLTISGLKASYMIDNNPMFNCSKEDGFRGVSLFDLTQIWIFTVLVEQLKRLSMLMTTTAGTYELLMKAAEVSKAAMIGTQFNEAVHITDFNKDHVEGWSLNDIVHPAKLVCQTEVDRIATVLMQLAVASGPDLMNKLLQSIIDSLKVSIVSQVLDKAYTDAKVQRSLVDKTLENLNRIKFIKDNTLSYSMKLQQFNIVWTLKLTLGRPITISRSSSSIATTSKDASVRLNKFRSRTDLKA